MTPRQPLTTRIGRLLLIGAVAFLYAFAIAHSWLASLPRPCC